MDMNTMTKPEETPLIVTDTVIVAPPVTHGDSVRHAETPGVSRGMTGWIALIIVAVAAEAFVIFRTVTNGDAATRSVKALAQGNINDAMRYSVNVLMGQAVDPGTYVLRNRTTGGTDPQEIPTPSASVPVPTATMAVSVPKETPSPTSLPAAVPSAYNLTYFDIDAATDKSYVKSGPIDAGRHATIQQTLTDARIKPELVEPYALVFTSLSAEQGEAVSTTITHLGKDFPIPEIGDKEGGKFHELYKYILIRGTLTGDALAEVLMHEIGHLVGDRLTPDEFKQFMESRLMSQAMIDSWYDFYKRDQEGEPGMEYGNWPANPAEDFAECFKLIYGRQGWPLKSNYGTISISTKSWFTRVVSPMVVR